MFPALVNCCTIDWFSEWPADALSSVARNCTKNIEMPEKIKEKCVDMLQYFHSTTNHWSIEFYTKLKRKYYVTPTSYIEMISSFQSLLSEKREKVSNDQNKYDNGYEKIINTEKAIEEM